MTDLTFQHHFIFQVFYSVLGDSSQIIPQKVGSLVFNEDVEDKWLSQDGSYPTPSQELTENFVF